MTSLVPFQYPYCLETLPASPETFHMGDDLMEHLTPVNPFTTLHREALLARIEKWTEIPLLVLAFCLFPLVVGSFKWSLSPIESKTFLALNLFIWVVFAVNLAVKIILAPHRWPYIRKHWMEVLIVIIPIARPLQIFYPLMLIVLGVRASTGLRRITNVSYLFVYFVGLVLVAATVVTSIEAGRNTGIASFFDAMWWAVVTATTVGYGDTVPITALGRVIAMVLMIGGVSLFSGLTANFASFLLKGEDLHLTQLLSEMEKLREDVARLSAGESRP